MGTLLGTFLIVGNFEIFSNILNFFQVSTLQCALGKVFFPENSPQNIFKTCLDTFKNVLDTFNNSFFSIFFRIFPSFDLQGALAKKFWKHHLKTSLDTLGIVFGLFWKFEIFSIFVGFFWFSRVNWAELFSVEKTNQNMLKQCFWERFWTCFKSSEYFQFSEVFPSLDAPGCTGLFCKTKYLKASSEHVWTLLGTVLDTFQISKVRFFFHFSPFFDPAGHDDFRKNHLVTCLNTVGYVFGHFWKTEIFSIFLNFFQISNLQCVIAIYFRKKYLKTSSEQASTLLGTVSDTLEILKFSIFSIFLLSNPQGALSNNFTEKISSKHVQNMFDCIWERFWAFWNCESFPSFLILFQVLTFLGALGTFFPRKLPQNKFKTCLDTFRNVFGHFSNFKSLIFFLIFLHFSTLQGMMISKKITS